VYDDQHRLSHLNLLHKRPKMNTTLKKTLATSAAAVFALSIVGCTSVGEIRTKQVIHSGVSKKIPVNLAGCIADKLEAKKMPNVQARPTSSGYTVMRVDQTLYGPDYAFIVDLEGGASTKITAYSALPFAAGNLMIVDAIKSCE
jgi:hypothetical protein